MFFYIFLKFLAKFYVTTSTNVQVTFQSTLNLILAIIYAIRSKKKAKNDNQSQVLMAYPPKEYNTKAESNPIGKIHKRCCYCMKKKNPKKYIFMTRQNKVCYFIHCVVLIMGLKWFNEPNAFNWFS